MIMLTLFSCVLLYTVGIDNEWIFLWPIRTLATLRELKILQFAHLNRYGRITVYRELFTINFSLILPLVQIISLLTELCLANSRQDEAVFKCKRVKKKHGVKITLYRVSIPSVKGADLQNQ